MATTTLGKRKRVSKVEIIKDPVKERRESASPEIDAQEIFRRHFEAQFQPLPDIYRSVEVREEDEDESGEDSEEESDWDGISEEEDGVVQVIEHKEVQAREAVMSREELKAFMSSKPPQNTSISTLVSSKTTVAPEDDLSEAANLKNDLALQRLLSESHLLSSTPSHTLDITGKNRHKATDLRLLALGSKSSILKQEKMPLAHRRGMERKKEEVEARRRREARENGIVLEKAVGRKGREGGKGAGEKEGMRDRGVGKPAVGKFQGGVLKLSKKDVMEIQGDAGGGGGRGGRVGGRGGKRRGRG